MKKISVGCLTFILFFLMVKNTATAQHITLLQQGKPTSIRGLSVVDDSVAWISGSKGYIATTANGGKTWNWGHVKGYEKADFRDIEAFSATEAVIMSSGTPTLILKTNDGGHSWQEKYRNADTAYFFDAMDFEDTKHGYILGDPISNKFLLMETKDGGNTWKMFDNRPDALPGEAAFAASGTCLTVDKNRISVVTGGSYSRKLTLEKKQTSNWMSSDLKIQHGKQSQGAFSIAYGNCNIIVGGDYAKDKMTDSVAEYCSYDGTYAGARSMLAITPPAGFQSCVEFIKDNIFLSTGTPGSNITTDGGKTWNQIDGTSFNVCRKAKSGNLVLLAGNNGKLAVLKQ